MTADRHIGARCALTLFGAVLLAMTPVGVLAQGVSGAELIAQLQNSAPAGDLDGAVSMARIHGVPDAALDDLLQRSRERGVDNAVLVSWIQNLDGLVRSRLPLDPVASRYLEGLAKGVPPARIDAAIDRLVARLEQAARYIDAKYPGAKDTESREARLTAIDHTAYVLGLGLNDQYMDRSLAMVLRESDSIRDLNSPILTLGILVSSGISPDKSLEVIDAAWTHGYRGPTLERLGKALGRLGQDGQAPPADLVDQVLRMIGSDAGQENVFREMDNLIGRDDYQLPGLGPGDDPTIRRGDTDGRETDPPSQPNTRDQFKPIERDAN
jgi:hypothetical protein